MNKPIFGWICDRCDLINCDVRSCQNCYYKPKRLKVPTYKKYMYEGYNLTMKEYSKLWKVSVSTAYYKVVQKNKY